MKSFFCLVAGALMCLPTVPVFSTSTAKGDIISNGLFENPIVVGEYTTINAGENGLPSWTVISGSVDVVRSGHGSPYEGLQMLDLDGSGPGVVQQSFSTTAGTLYDLSFAYANNPIFGQVPASARIEIISNGVDILNQTVTHNSAVSPGSPADYSIFNVNFTANAPIAALRFTSLDNPSSLGGILFDNVSVTMAPEPTSIVIFAVGTIALLRRRRN